jgi:hypothetical protein
VPALAVTLEQSIRTASLSSGMALQAPRLLAGLAWISFAVGLVVLAFGALLPRFRGIALLGLPFVSIGVLVLAAVRRMRAAAPGAPRS